MYLNVINAFNCAFHHLSPQQFWKTLSAFYFIIALSQKALLWRIKGFAHYCTCTCTVAAMWSWSISAFLTVSLTIISRTVGVVFFCSWFAHRQKKASPRQLWWAKPSHLKERPVPCALLPPGGRWGEQSNISKGALPWEVDQSSSCIKISWLHLRRFFAISLEGKK